MGCGNSLKNSHYKSCERFYNNNAQNLSSGESINLTLGSRVTDTGVSISADTQSYTTLTRGLYHISGDIVLDATTIGTGTFSVYMDGVQLPCTVRNITASEGNNVVHTETELYLGGCCCNVEHNFTFVFSSETVAGTITSCTGIMKVA